MDTEDVACLAWAAGLIDGEGCVHYDVDPQKSGASRFKWHLTVKMTHEPTIRKLAELFPDGHRPYYDKEAAGNRKNTHLIRWNGRNALRVLKALYPYLVTKKCDADHAIEFYRAKENDDYPEMMKCCLALRKKPLASGSGDAPSNAFVPDLQQEMTKPLEGECFGVS